MFAKDIFFILNHIYIYIFTLIFALTSQILLNLNLYIAYNRNISKILIHFYIIHSLKSILTYTNNSFIRNDNYESHVNKFTAKKNYSYVMIYSNI